MASGTPAAGPRMRRVRKRILIPSVLLGLLVLLFIVLYYRGTVADGAARNPKTVAEGTLTHLYRDPDGQTWVRCAILIDAAPADVWAMISDYDRHAAFLPYISELTAKKGEDGRFHISGVAHSRIWGDWPFASKVKHDETPERGEYAATWDEPSADMPVHKGSWTIQPAGDKQALLVFALQIEASGYPNFLVRNILMDRLHTVLKAVRTEVAKGKI